MTAVKFPQQSLEQEPAMLNGHSAASAGEIEQAERRRQQQLQQQRPQQFQSGQQRLEQPQQ